MGPFKEENWKTLETPRNNYFTVTNIHTVTYIYLFNFYFLTVEMKAIQQ